MSASTACNPFLYNIPLCERHLHDTQPVAGYIQELNMHHGLYSAVARSMQHYERLQSHGKASASGKLQVSGSEVSLPL